MEDYEETNSLDIVDDEELDLIALVSSNANDTSQYLVFVGSDNQYYAKNVSKIEELLVYKDIDLMKNNREGIIVGTADIRGNMTTIINFDKWFGNEVLEDSEYELIVLAHYGGHRVGIVVKSVEYIVNIPAETMSDNSQTNDKSSFICKVNIGQKEEMCTVFDSDKMLLDTFETIDTNAADATKTIERVQTQKIVLFADDSRFIRKMAESLFLKMNMKHKMYENGQLLLDDLSHIVADDISLIITDLEMPITGGREVISQIRKNSIYDAINIIVHTNMANDNMGSALIEVGAQEIIGKVNMLALHEAMQKLMR